MLSILSLMTLFLQATTTANTQSSSASLSPDSVVLITGAAGFLGSELCMALVRTYNVRKIIAIDSMSGSSSSDLALFEFQRQRAFHVLQELSERVHFYRSHDLAPSIPEYFDLGEVPLLEYIWREHPDISHVVHLAENSAQAPYMAVPRTKESVKAGLLESLLEAIVKLEENKRPHLIYASSYEVYNDKEEENLPFSEVTPLTTPSSLRGAAKLLDELLAQTYYETDHIYSVGLRFFSIYGPWGIPGSPLFEMAERAVGGADRAILLAGGGGGEKDLVWDDVRDYLYIDDCMDAIMSAMQVRTNNNVPLTLNVGSGKGTSLRSVAKTMEKLLPRSSDEFVVSVDKEESSSASVVYASTTRAQQILGFQPQVSLEEGLTKLLAWHYDRAFPYGGGGDTTSDGETKNQYQKAIANKGIVSCLPYDKECLKGTPVFPCASECSHEAQCTTSYYDDVMVVTRSLTNACRDVMYTVALDEDLETVPSAGMEGTSSSRASHLSGPCNVAFVSESSPLVQRLKPDQGFSSGSTVIEQFLRIFSHSNGKEQKVLTYGYWILIPVWTPSFTTGDEGLFRLLPKLSPGLFFGKETMHAVYCDPNVIFKNVMSLIREAQMQPYLEGVEGATAMLVARERPGPTSAFGRSSRGLPLPTESVQNAAYRMIQIGAIDEMIAGEGTSQHALIDSSWIVHKLQSEDSRLFRCDVLGEIVQWDVPTDKTAFEFIMELHDMWSRVFANSKGNDPWWIGEDVRTVPEDRKGDGSESVAAEGNEVGDKLAQGRRRLEAEESEGAQEGQPEEQEEETGAEKEETESKSREGETSAGEKEMEESDKDKDATVDGVDVDAKEVLQEDKEEEAVDDESGPDEDAGEKSEAFSAKKATDEGDEGDNEGFLGEKNDPEVDTGAVNVVKQPDEATSPEETETDQISHDGGNDVDTGEEEEGAQKTAEELGSEDVDRDMSAHDLWMGVLSSTSTYYFVRIVQSSEVGVMYIDDYSVE